jgi:release factor glutamine methyltransferase
MTLAEFIASAIDKLKQAAIGNPQLDARLLVGHALGLDRAKLLSQAGRVLGAEEISAIDRMLVRRVTHESVARIIGHREFWGLEFGLNEATLEPRPDSETLIEAVLSSFPRKRESSASDSEHMSLLSRRRATLDSRFRGNDDIRILDLGTGTGCLLLALLHEIPVATGLGIDINPRAVERAAKNAAALGIGNRAEFCTGNWLAGITELFDIIVSNPPYIPTSDIRALMPEVRDHDPRCALDGGEDGLTPYRLLIPQLKNFLNPNGIAAFEVGQCQAERVVALFQKNGFTNITTHKDLGGIERCVTAYRPW